MTSNIYPREFPYNITVEPKRRAEKKVYNALQKELNDEFIIYYNVPWTAEISESNLELKDGEADFIVLWRDHGFISLEVKGGGVGYEQNTMAYFSVGADGKRHTIKDPFEQAKRSKHVLLNQLKSHKGFNHQKVGGYEPSPEARIST